MTSTPSPQSRPTPPASGLLPRAARAMEELREIDLREWFLTLWEGRLLMLASIAFCMALGLFIIWRSTPIYQAEAMLQIEPPKNVRDSDAAFARMGNLFTPPSDALTEIEIIGSSLILGRTVEALDLDLVARPVRLPIIGDLLAGSQAAGPRVEVETFQIPAHFRGLLFQIVALPGGTFAWKSPSEPPAQGNPGAAYPEDALLATGRPGDLLTATWGGEKLTLQVRTLSAKPGQAFRLQRRPLQAAITDIRNDLEASEKGASQANRTTNLLALAYRHPNPALAADILNEIMKQYLRQNAQRKSGEISQTLALLQQQLPEVQDKLKQAEAQLNQYRAQTGAVDLVRETDLALQRGAALATQISALKQRRQELLRTYMEGSDLVTTIDAQIAKLESESAGVNRKVQALPGAQQTIMRLSRDVQANTELYTTILNSIKQLQVTQAGEAQNTRVIDAAMPGLKPVKPKKAMLVAVFLILGVVVGIGLVLGKAALFRGVEDHRIIENRLGIPVFATIPHSKAQEGHQHAISGGRPGTHILAFADPDDLATESLRSLRTMLGFYLRDLTTRTVLVTGPSPMVGKSFVSTNLAAVLAQAHAKVLLVDADMRRGSLHAYFGLDTRKGGLSEVLSGKMPWRSAVQSTDVPGLQVLCSGAIPRHPAELLTTPVFSTFVAEASREYEFVVFDAPPLLPVTDAAIIGSKVGLVLLVAKAGQHPLDELRTCQVRLESNGISLDGCVFNDIMPTGLSYYDQRYRYGYLYAYGKAEKG
ncbi:polysaccharide biosynthesis tyrosine autokinase [Geothrix edaphica]|nr:polysaccharide biosynthesis tyrosine autokinase [Geothrix edaphica]